MKPSLGLLRFLVVLSLLLSACAPTIKTGGPPVEPPHLAGDALVTADGTRLPLRRWLPAAPPKAAILAVHGFNDYSNAFDEPGKTLSAQGIAVYAFDLRGFGAAPDHGYWAGEGTLTEDIATAARLVAAQNPGVPLYLLGESMGGALVMVTMTRPDAPPVQGIILSAPAVWSRDTMNIFQRGALWVAYHTMPWLTLTGRGLHIQASDNIEMLRALGRDPLVIKETRVDAINGLCDLMDDAAAAAPQLHVPALILYGEKDQVVPAEPTYRMMASLPDNPVPQVKAVYAGGYHMLLRDLEAKVPLGDIASWIGAPSRPLPSGADTRAQALLGQGVENAAAPAAKQRPGGLTDFPVPGADVPGEKH